MLINSEIIAKLTEEQKLALVTDIGSLSNDALTALGVPHAEVSALDELNRKFGGDAVYAPLGSLANSWNTKLAENVVGDIVRRNGTERYNIIETPNIGVKCSAYADGFSEDAYLCARFGGAFASAVEQYGGTACIAEYGICDADIEYLDKTPSETVLSNVVSRPFDAVMRSRAPVTVRMSYSKAKGEWKDVNARLISGALEKDHTRAVICDGAYEEALRGGITTPKLLFLGAPVSAVRAALKNYRRMKSDVERGSVTVDELNNALEIGTALSDEMLDEAVDKVIEFAKAAARERESYPAETEENDGARQSKQYALLAAEESTVLLKNAGGVLPIVSAVKLAAVGELINAFPDFDAAVNNICNARGATFIGRADGYSIDSDRSDELTAQAAELAKNADVVLVFVGLGERRERSLSQTKCSRLPANQAALLDAVAKTGKTVIAVVTGGVLPEMSFDRTASAVLYAPSQCSRSAESLFNILFGVICPSGKLAVTAYDDTDARFAALQRAVAAGRYKTGEFIGYRRYTTENEKLRYPFGHGLSYTEFVYSNLKINADSVEVTVRNVGARAGFEVAQLYVGKVDSALVRPERELKGFAKVMIAPSAAVQITFPLNAAMLEVFDVNDGKRKTEAGKYKIYVGASSADIKLSGEAEFSGVKIEARGDKLSDYLPAFSNIVSGGYKMDAVAKTTQGAFKSARPDGDGYDFDRLFAEEFGQDESEEEQAEVEGSDDGFEYLDDGVTVKTVADGLAAYATANGVKLGANTATEIVAAFAASRVVLLRCDKSEFAELVRVLCGYFGCPCGIDDAEGYANSDDLFGHGTDSCLTESVAFASGRREVVTVVALDNVKASKLGAVFAPFIRYATAPDDITVTFGASKRTVDVPRNLWFVMRLSDGDCTDYPVYLADMTGVVIPEIASAQASGASADATPNFYQLDAACKKAERDYEIEELLWKKVDRLEAYASARTEFSIGNKMWVQMEKFIAVCLACGLEPTDALDRTVAEKLVPVVAAVLNGKLADDEPLTQTFESIFGEEEAVRCVNAVKRMKA